MSKLCFGCMRQKESSPICEYCGYDETSVNLSHQLPIGTILQNQYLIGRVLGQGGFGITYIGWDQNLSIPVAIKEYYPGGVVQRHTQLGNHVTCANGEKPDLFQKHRDKFLKEARTLAQLSDIPEIVQIRSFFSANDTAYIVMEYVDGITLKTHMKQLGRPMTEAEALEVMEPVLRALKKVHAQHLIHRDISPDNIMLPKNGGVKLIDFGTVRYVDDSGVSKSTEAVLKPGFAPIEQYNTRGELGTWTDVYALCASFHYLLTGRVPADVHERLVSGDQLTVLRSRQGISRKLIETLEKGMKIMPAERIQTIEQLYKLLYPQQKKAPQKKKQETKAIRQEEPKSKRNEKTEQAPKKKRLPLIGALAAAAALVCGIFLLKPSAGPSSEGDFTEAATAPAVLSQQEHQYQEAVWEMEQENYALAMDLFLALGDYEDSAYQAEQCRLALGYEEAALLAEAGEHAKAGIAFAKLGDYQDAHERSLCEWNLTRSRNIVVSGHGYAAIKKDGTVVSDQYSTDSWSDIIDLEVVSMGNGVLVGIRTDGTIVIPGDSWVQQMQTIEEMCTWHNVAKLYNSIGICYDGTVVSYDGVWDDPWTDIVDVQEVYLKTWSPNSWSTGRDQYSYIGLKIDGTLIYEGDIYDLDPQKWCDIVKLDVGEFGIVGFKSDGSVVVAEPPEEDYRYRYVMDNWDDVIAVSGYYRLKSDGTVDAPEAAIDYYRSFSGAADTNIPRFPAKDVRGLTDIRSIYAYSGDSGLYCIKNDNSVIYVGDSYNGAANVSEYTNIVEIFEGYIGLRADGTLAIAEAHGSDAEKWTDIRVP